MWSLTPRAEVDGATEALDITRGYTIPVSRRLIIVPAFNEAAIIGRVVDDILLTLPDYDVVVVDDGSTDGTADCIPHRARVLKLPFNLGIGGAMQTGYMYAARHGYDVAVQVDGDGQHPADAVPLLVQQLETSGCDLVVGSRFLQDTGYEQQPARVLGIAVLALLLRLLTGRRFTDCTSGFRAANRRVIELFAQWYPDDYPEPEVILLLHRAGYRIEERAVEMLKRRTGRTSIPFLRGVFYIIKVSLALLLDTVRDPWRHASK
ncbi:MAG: glycosyltransferase family 2 protein [Phycisphaeraceae bacterium]|nr:glycosyltransferase family 2 protein [Phycisphaeraceae bacterium]